jgi:hypothetical protein
MSFQTEGVDGFAGYRHTCHTVFRRKRGVLGYVPFTFFDKTHSGFSRGRVSSYTLITLRHQLSTRYYLAEADEWLY